MISISTIEELQLIGNDVAYPLSGDYEITQNIDASGTATWNGGEGFEPIAGHDPFTGTLDGKGYSIDGLVINRPSDSYIGLIDEFTGTIIDLHLTNVDIHGDDTVGSLVSEMSGGTIFGCSASGTVHSAWGDTGGLVSWCWDGTIEDSYSTCSVTSDNGNLVGGFAGDIGDAAIVRKCYSTGDVIAAWSEVGGFIGRVYGDGSTTIEQCYAAGNVTSDTGSADVGGFVGRIDECIISKCYASGDVSAAIGVYVGGFIGESYLDTISDCYAIGSVSGDESVGGFVGEPCDDTITNCYSTGAVSGNVNVGGFIGNEYTAGGIYSCIITSCYWDTQTSGQALSDGATAKTTTQMKQEATFSGWNFSTIWEMVETMTYPLFSASYSLEIEVRNLGIYCKSADIDISLDGNGFSLAVYALTAKTPGEFRSYSFSEPLLLSNSVISAATLSDT